MRNLIVLIPFLILSGCSSTKSYSLDPQFRPLEEIRERPTPLRDALSETTITTVGKYCYVRDLDRWLGNTPANSPKFKAILRHEQEHSYRQLRTGTFLWILRYSYDKEFALKEEQRGYYYEITERRRLGDYFMPEAYAAVLSNYKILTGKIISYEEALVWVRAVLSGQWTPPSD